MKQSVSEERLGVQRLQSNSSQMTAGCFDMPETGPHVVLLCLIKGGFIDRSTHTPLWNTTHNPVRNATHSV